MRRTRRFSLDKKQKELMIAQITGQVEEMPEIILAFIHGSFLDGEDFGDIDLALFLSPSCPAAKDNALEYELKMELLLDKITGISVDVRVLNQAPKPFCYSVLKNGRLLFCRDEEIYADFLSHTVVSYFDFVPYRNYYLKEVLGLEI